MPYTKVGVNKISDHNVTSPLIQGMVACQQCHTESAEWLKARSSPFRTAPLSLMLRAGYATAVAAKLFEVANQAQTDGKSIDQKLYDQAKDLYLDAFYRVNLHGRRELGGLP